VLVEEETSHQEKPQEVEGAGPVAEPRQEEGEPGQGVAYAGDPEGQGMPKRAGMLLTPWARSKA
jgi:hypothetical protein